MFKTLAALAIGLMMTATAAADPIRWAQEGWKTDFSKTEIDLARVLSGGPPRDGIPSIDDPQFQPVSADSELVGTEPVIGVTIGGDARAYPLRIMTWHEIVNDVVGGTPLAITYCPLCNSAPVFERTVDGAVLEFGTTGKLKDSNLIMYDRQTETWWQQFTGRAVTGEMTGAKLELVPARLQSWDDFKAENPDGQVLVPNDPNMRPYWRNPYVGYDTAGAPFLYDGQLPEDINPMERVIIVPQDDADPVVVTMAKIAEATPLAHGGYDFTWKAGQNSALDQQDIRKGRDVGTVLVSRDGADVAYDVTFAFVARAFHPDVAILQR